MCWLCFILLQVNEMILNYLTKKWNLLKRHTLWLGRKRLAQQAWVAQALYIANKDLSLGTVLNWLLGAHLWALGKFYLIGVFCMPGPWAMLFYFDEISLTMRFMVKTYLLGSAGVAEASYVSKHCKPKWQSPNKNPGNGVRACFSGLWHFTYQCIPFWEKLGMPYVLLLEGYSSMKTHTWFLWTLLYELCPFADRNVSIHCN